MTGRLESGRRLDDDELVEEIRRDGSPDLFRVLVERYQQRVFRLMTSVLGPAFAMDAEDAAQEVFLQVYRKLGQFGSQSRFSTWLYRVAYSKAIDHRRKVARHRADPLQDDLPPARAADAAENPLLRSLGAERRRVVLGALERLSEPQRTAIRLRYWFGCSVREIAEMTDTNDGTVKSHLFRGRRRLAQELSREGST